MKPAIICLKVGLYFRRRQALSHAFIRLSHAYKNVLRRICLYFSRRHQRTSTRARKRIAQRKTLQSSTVLNFRALRWVYTFDAVKRRIRRHSLRWFAALALAFRLASTCASVVVKSINPRAYKPSQKLIDFQELLKILILYRNKVNYISGEARHERKTQIDPRSHD